ncbi:MAG TPA: hypothetical protein VGP46_01370 [Acidimicrobiales bacterium]|nr:hypothetical protein [Acidimicrobiales bacterium]
MSLQREDVDKLLAPGLVVGLPDVALDEVRTRRDACKRVEDLVSYLRRVVQGQLDLVQAEASLRLSGARGDLGALVDSLPGILAGPPKGATTSGGSRPVASNHSMANTGEMFDMPNDLSPELGEILFGSGSMPAANLGSFTDAELAELGQRLSLQEQELSEQRRALHERIDLLQATIVERYKSGAADIDSLLTQPPAGEADRSEGT